MDALPIILFMVVIVGAWAIALEKFKLQTVVQAKVGPLLQWYSLWVFGVAVVFVRTLWDVIKWEYIKLDFLTRTDLADVPNLTDADRRDLEIPEPLRYFSLLAPLAGMAACCIVVWHTIETIRANRDAYERCADEHEASVRNGERRRPLNKAFKWALPKEKTCEILVITVPMVFTTLALRAQIRIWTIMTGSAWQPHMWDIDNGTTWADVQKLELGMYTSDLEMAGFFQYITIYSFTKLVQKYCKFIPSQQDAIEAHRIKLRRQRTWLFRSETDRGGEWWRFLPCFPNMDVGDTPDDIRRDRARAFKRVGFQGVSLYVILGMFRALGATVFAFFLRSHNYDDLAAIYQDKVLAFISPVFTTSTLLCIYNMVIVCNMKDVQDRLGNGNLKFMATRLLLLIQQVQHPMLLGLVVGANIYDQIEKEKMAPGFIKRSAEYLNLSIYRAKLFHAALLCFECLIVVVANRCFWDPVAEEKMDAARREAAESEAASASSRAAPEALPRALPLSAVMQQRALVAVIQEIGDLEKQLELKTEERKQLEQERANAQPQVSFGMPAEAPSGAPGNAAPSNAASSATAELREPLNPSA